MKQPGFASFASVLAACFLLSCNSQSGMRTDDEAVVWKSAEYTLYRDSLVQGPHRARALSATELTSNYRSPANAFLSPEITFKFSLNGKDNEMAPGQDHKFAAVARGGSGVLETPVITFGQRFADATPVPVSWMMRPSADTLRSRLFTATRGCSTACARMML